MGEAVNLIPLTASPYELRGRSVDVVGLPVNPGVLLVDGATLLADISGLRAGVEKLTLSDAEGGTGLTDIEGAVLTNVEEKEALLWTEFS